MNEIQTLNGGQPIQVGTSSPEEKGDKDGTVSKVERLIGGLCITPS